MNAHERQRRAIETKTDPRWQTVVTRDRADDGRFFYSVKTTGVYCRPSCAARLPLPENVSFHATQMDAEQAGFRACKRCRPNVPRDGSAPTSDTQADRVVHYAIGECSLGTTLVAKRAGGICAILMGDDPASLELDVRHRFRAASFVRDDKGLQRELGRAIAFIEAPALDLDLPLAIRGTDFQQCVWQALREIPVGNTASYAQIAQRIGSPNATRAVAGACAANPLAVVIPCHRVVRGDGALSGYRWGAERKRALLQREARA